MSTQKKNVTARRMSMLGQTDEKIFHAGDLANLWNIQDKNTLRTTLKRYVDHGLFYRVYKGFYSLLPIEKLNPLLLGAKALHGFCYLTTETVLFEEGYISHKLYAYTFVSEKNKKYEIGEYRYVSRQLQAKYLYNDAGVFMVDGFRKATVERAIADILYFNPQYTFDKRPDWDRIQHIQKNIGYDISSSTRRSP